MHLGPQMAKIRVDNRKRVIFLHWTIWGAPLDIKILKIGLRSDLKWPKLGLEPKFHDPGTFGGFGKIKIGPEPKFHVPRSSNGKD